MKQSQALFIVRRFTVIELLTTMIVVMIIVGIVVGGVGMASKRADDAKAQAQIAAFSLAFEQFKADEGYYPYQPSNSFQITSAFITNNLSSYLSIQDPPFDNNPNDPWGIGYYYKSPGTVNVQTFDIASLGLDGKPGKILVDDDALNGVDDTAEVFSATQLSIDSDDIANWKRN